MLLTVGIALLCPEIFGKYDWRTAGLNRGSKIRCRMRVAFILGGIEVSVCFTSLAAWIPIGFIVSFCNFSCGDVRTYREFFKNGLYHIWNLCAIYGALGMLIGCAIDWYFYGSFGAIPFLGNFHFNVILGKLFQNVNNKTKEYIYSFCFLFLV